MKIYTRTGDEGETGLFAGPRVAKDALRIAAYGDVDELNSTLGLARAETPPADLDARLRAIQNELFCLGAELATPDPQAKGTDFVGEAHVEALERAIDACEAELTPLRQFILPAGSRLAATLHVARTVCRRAERAVVSLRRAEPQVEGRVVRYLNRLSDYLFVAARLANRRAGVADVPWEKPNGA